MTLSITASRLMRFVLLVACCTLAAPAFAADPQAKDAKPAPDVVIFTNGDQLTGKFERGIADSIVFKSDMAGEITIPLAKIKELHVAGSFAVLRKDIPVTKKTRDSIHPGAIEYGKDEITVSSSKAAPEEVPVKQLGFIVDEPTYHKEVYSNPSFLQGWNGAVTAGATVVRSTDNGTTFNAGVALVRAIPTVSYLPRRNRTLFNLTETYGKLTTPTIPQTTPPTPDAVAKTSIFHTDGERDEYFTPRLYALGAVSFDHNYSQGLNLQQVYGGGIGWTVLQSAIQQLDVKGDIHYEKQHFIQPTPQVPPLAAIPDQNLIGATIAEVYLRHLPRKLLFTESASFLPAFNNSNAYSANFAAGLALPVYHRFSANFGTTDNYLNNPSPGYKKNSYQLTTGITYTLH